MVLLPLFQSSITGHPSLAWTRLCAPLRTCSCELMQFAGLWSLLIWGPSKFLAVQRISRRSGSCKMEKLRWCPLTGSSRLTSYLSGRRTVSLCLLLGLFRRPLRRLRLLLDLTSVQSLPGTAPDIWIALDIWIPLLGLCPPVLAADQDLLRASISSMIAISAVFCPCFSFFLRIYVL